jgi:hypothetical protein
MRVTAIALATAALFPSAICAGPASNKFDLECSDTVETTGNAVPAYLAHYRIDLVARKWCEAECRTVKPIAVVQSSYITLEGEPNSDYWHTLDREKGEDQIFSQIDGMEHTTGQCKRLPFSGFPAFKTKF